MRDRGRVSEQQHLDNTCRDRLPFGAGWSVDRIGLAAFLLGALALPAASLPWLRYAAIPLAVAGAALAVFALVRGWPQQRSILVPAAGLAACLVCLVLACWSSLGRSGQGAAAQKDGQRVAPLRGGGPTKANVTALTSPWVDASRQAVLHGDVRVRVVGVAVQKVPIQDDSGRRRWSQQRALLVGVRLSNVGVSQAIRYAGWSAAVTADDSPTLRDHLGRTYPARTFAAGWTVVGQVRHAGLVPGKWTDDLLVFAAPPANVAFLRLTLPASAFGGTGLLQLELPRQMIVFR